MTQQCSSTGPAGLWRRLVTLMLAVGMIIVIGTTGVNAQSLQTHWVQPGDSLWSVARQYGTTVTELRQANGLKSDLIFVGDRLQIPVRTTQIAASEDDVRWLAQLIWSEAEGEPYIGQVAVGAVVLNRVRSHLFPNTIKGVIFDGWQFEPVVNGRIYNPAPPIAYRAAYDALSGWDPSHGALYFFNPALTQNSFLWARPATTVIGAHRFTR